MVEAKSDDRWNWDRYHRVMKILAPNARAPHDIFIDQVIEGASGRRWLDAGCGRHSFPEWRENEFLSVIELGTTDFGCDLDFSALRDREDKSRVCMAGLEKLPFKDNSFEFVSSGMVFEHLSDPESAVRELVRVTSPGGKILIHTVHSRHYLALIARITPHWFHEWIVGRVEGRDAKDVYPTRYRANTVSRLRELFGKDGCCLVRGGAIDGVPMNLPYPILFWVAMAAGLLERLLAKTPGLGSFLKPNILVEFQKIK